MQVKPCVALVATGLLLFCIGCAQSIDPIEAADAVYLNGRIYTLNSETPWSEAVAIKDGRILFVGSNADAQTFVGQNTERVDLRGKMAMPGLYDSHIHFLQGSEETVYGCRFSESATPDEIAAAVQRCVADGVQHTNGWIVGGNFDSSLLLQPDKFNRAVLDAVAPDVPVFLWNNSHHDAIANSTALAALGILADTPDPEDGRIVRESGSREPNGVLIEKAAFDAGAELPRVSTEQLAAAAESVQANLNRFGIVGLKDAGTTPHILDAYKYLDDRDRLKLRVGAALVWQSTFLGAIDDPKGFVQERDRYRGQRVNTDFVKIFLDGAPPGKTAAFLDPYVADELTGEDFRGQMIDSEQLKQDLIWLDGEGVTVKMHAAGDASVRAALDAVAAARAANGNSGLLHEVSHASFIADSDLARFGELGVAAEFSPVIWHPHPVLDYLAKFLDGGRVDRMWPIRDLVEGGAVGIAGSDWPTVGAAQPNPWWAIEAMVTRRHPTGQFPGEQNPTQAIPLDEVLKIYTINGARAIRAEDESGSIEVGKAADIIVLDRNLFDIDPDDISETQVLTVLLDGELVYKQDTGEQPQ
ncbi:MAG: amidohydrolase [Gammaproteobacteria bacterium]|nr:amidohydrolase [Gammaproteobacteria bacterium]